MCEQRVKGIGDASRRPHSAGRRQTCPPPPCSAWHCWQATAAQAAPQTRPASPGSTAFLQAVQVMEPQLAEAEVCEDLGFFFKRLGEICFSPASSQAFPGPARSLAVAAEAGAVFFSDAQGKLWEGICGVAKGVHPSTKAIGVECCQSGPMRGPMRLGASRRAACQCWQGAGCTRVHLWPCYESLRPPPNSLLPLYCRRRVCLQGCRPAAAAAEVEQRQVSYSMRQKDRAPSLCSLCQPCFDSFSSVKNC